MERGSIETLIREFYRSRLANDADACLAHFADGATLRVAGSPEASPIAGGSRELDALRRQIAALVFTWAWQEMTTESLTIDGGRAAVHYRLQAVFQPTGDEVSTEVLDLIEMQDGRITSYVEFVDTALAAALSARTAA